MTTRIFFVFSIDYQLISHRMAIVEAACMAGYDVTVVARNTGYKAEIQGLGVRFVDLPINRVGTNILEELKTLTFLYRLYKKEKPDIVHHVSLKVVLWGGVAARCAGVKGVVNAVNGLGVFFGDGQANSFLKKRMLGLMRWANGRKGIVTIFQNRDDLSFFRSHGVWQEEQIEIIPGSGVDLSVFRYVPEKPSDKLVILFSSRMVKEKGVLDIIEAARILRPEYENKISFLLYGLLETNPCAIRQETLEEACDGIYLRYAGFCREIRKVLEKAAIVILPSYYREGIPKSLIEAAAVGRPILTTDSVGCRETVIDGVNGYLVPVKDPAAIADRLKRMIDDTELRRKMGLASRKMAEEKFSIEQVVSKHLAIYARVGR